MSSPQSGDDEERQSCTMICMNERGTLLDIPYLHDEPPEFGDGLNEWCCVGTLLKEPLHVLMIEGVPRRPPYPENGVETTYDVKPVMLVPTTEEKEEGSDEGGDHACTVLNGQLENKIDTYPKLFDTVSLPSGVFVYVHCQSTRTFHGMTSDNKKTTHHILEMLVVPFCENEEHADTFLKFKTSLEHDDAETAGEASPGPAKRARVDSQ